MNVLLLSQFFSTTRGGGEYVFNIIAKKLAENNHKVWIITNKIKDEKYQYDKNIHLVFVPPTLEYKGGLPPSFSDNLRYAFNAIRKGKKIIKSEKIDLIHSNNFAPAIAGSMLSFLTSKPHITSIWDIFTLCGNDYWSKWVKQEGVSKIHAVLGPKIEKLILKVPCKIFHTISETTKDDLIKFGAKKQIQVIFPSIEEKEIEKQNQNSAQFIYVGRLVFYKNLEVLIRAVKIVKKKEPEIKLIIVGGGPYKRKLMDLIKKEALEPNIIFKGYVDGEEKMKLISQSNALLFPSLCEGFGLVILEAFSLSKPVLVSDIRPMSEIVSHEETGYVLNPHDENEWANKMLDLMHNPEMSTRLGSSGRKVFENKYNIQTMYKKIIEMYNNVI